MNSSKYFVLFIALIALADGMRMHKRNRKHKNWEPKDEEIKKYMSQGKPDEIAPEYEEIALEMLGSLTVEEIQELKANFDKSDVDKDGFLNFEELRNNLSKYKLDDTKLQTVMDWFDINKDNLMSFFEMALLHVIGKHHFNKN